MQQNQDNNQIQQVGENVERVEENLERVEERVGLVEQTMTIHSGPLPPSDELKRYEEIQPGLADRIMRMAEKEQTFRHEHNLKALKFETETRSRDSLLGIFGGFALVVLSFIFSLLLAYLGHEKVAMIVAGTTIISIFTNIIKLTRINQDKDSEDN